MSADSRTVGAPGVTEGTRCGGLQRRLHVAPTGVPGRQSPSWNSSTHLRAGEACYCSQSWRQAPLAWHRDVMHGHRPKDGASQGYIPPGTQRLPEKVPYCSAEPPFVGLSATQDRPPVPASSKPLAELLGLSLTQSLTNLTRWFSHRSQIPSRSHRAPRGSPGGRGRDPVARPWWRGTLTRLLPFG